MKRRIVGVICMCLGVVVLLSAAALLAFNLYEDARADHASQVLLPIVEEAMKAPAPSQPQQTAPSQVVELPDPTMKEVEIDGYRYIGTLSIPAIALELPVQSDWSYPQLRISPCRYAGSTKTDDLVLLAHNYRKHFRPIKTLELGTQVVFTDMEGEVISYQVVATEVMPESAVEEITAGVYDLTLFTCTYGGSNTRYAVHCDRV